MKERLQKIISSRGIASRRAAEQMIAEGRVTCNGAICHIGDHADPDTDIIFLDGKPLPPENENIYIMLNKPKGYVTTLRDEKGRKNVTELVADCGVRVYPVGRLDMDSEGLLLFTNDGEFANTLMHPKHEINKTYKVLVKGYSDENLKKLKLPIKLDGYLIKKPDVELIYQNGSEAEIIIRIHEGRNRQVRRMCAAANMPVKRLVRIAEGDLKLGSLPVGKWRHLTSQEVVLLQRSDLGDGGYNVR